MGDIVYKIIIVDDDISNLKAAKDAIADKHDVFTVPSGAKLFLLLEKLTPDLILLDVAMPDMDGYEVMKILKSQENTASIPVIFLTAVIDPVSEVEGLNAGAIDYITKPFSSELLLKRIDVHMTVEMQRKELQNYSKNLEIMVSRKTQSVFGLQNAILEIVVELVESRDNVTGCHIDRVQSYMSLFVNKLLNHGVYMEELSSWDINRFVMSSQLHDVGKITIKDNILMKPSKLTDEECDEMKKHTTYGVEIITKIEKKTPECVFLRHAKIIAGSHHERWDGTGYPFGMKGGDIPLQGRLMAIIDVYDALTNDRPYKKATSHERALEIIKNGIGTSFDPLLGNIFLKYENEFKHIKGSRDHEAYPQPHGSVPWGWAPQAVPVIPDTRLGLENEGIDRVRRYLAILVSASAQHDRYKGEISSWDIGSFLMSAQLRDVGAGAVGDGALPMEENSLLHHAEALAGSRREKWDGSGRPLGLKGAEIPLQGRLMAIADIYDDLTSDRPDREKMSHQEAVKIIKDYSGTYFDPELIRIFINHEREFEKVMVLSSYKLPGL